MRSDQTIKAAKKNQRDLPRRTTILISIETIKIPPIKLFKKSNKIRPSEWVAIDGVHGFVSMKTKKEKKKNNATPSPRPKKRGNKTTTSTRTLKKNKIKRRRRRSFVACQCSFSSSTRSVFGWSIGQGRVHYRPFWGKMMIKSVCLFGLVFVWFLVSFFRQTQKIRETKTWKKKFHRRLPYFTTDSQCRFPFGPPQTK